VGKGEGKTEGEEFSILNIQFSIFNEDGGAAEKGAKGMREGRFVVRFVLGYLLLKLIPAGVNPTEI
ncbi:MAG: hypothetical protein KAG97_00475, partial [Victivallales bacterium]|nr:hypothetical protein [Victivallales bacterium]